MPDKERIVVLDDNPVALRLTRAHLEGLGFDVQVAASMAEFSQVFQAFAPQIILTDVEMPGTTGDDICRQLRQSADTANIPILLFSGLDEAELAQRAERAGADGYICKTAGPDALKQKLLDLLSDVLL